MMKLHTQLKRPSPFWDLVVTTSPHLKEGETDEDDEEFGNEQAKLLGTAKLNAISTDTVIVFKASNDSKIHTVGC